MDARFAISATLSPKVTFASQQHAVPVIRALRVTNAGEAASELCLAIGADPPFLQPASWPIDRIEAGGAVEVAVPDVALDAALLLGLTESLRGRAVLRLTQGSETLAEAEHPVELLARHEWGGGSMAELLAAFVMPNDPAIDRVLKGAAGALARAGKPEALDGYRGQSRSRVWELASAIWSAVASLGLSYALPPASFETSGQKVRVPSAVLEGGLATCLDAALLFAAALEQAGLNPIVVLTRGHAFAGVWLQPQQLQQVITDDDATLRKHLALDELLVFETTLSTQRPTPAFSVALKEAQRQLAPDRSADFTFALDVRRARMQRLRPLAIGSAASPVAGASVPPTGVAAGLESAPPLPGFDLDRVEAPAPAVATPADRLRRWQRRLLDLTTRNRLLNVSVNATTLQLVCPDAAKLEDRLAVGAKIRIVAQPDLKGTAGRSEALHFARTGERLLEAYAAEALSRDEVLSPLDAGTLAARLIDLYRKARLDLQEGGANTLFLAVGLLCWKKQPADARAYRAPLVLLPVALERKSVRSGVQLVLHDDEPRFNLTLLELLRQDFGLTIPELEGALPQDECGLDIKGIWTLMRKAVQDLPGLEVVEETLLGTFSFAKHLMWRDLVDRAEVLRNNPVARQLLDSPREPFRDGTVFPATVDLDEVLDPAEVFAPLPADSSQLRAVLASAQGCNFVLDGPPGTGKSQTIANIIAHNLALGRRVLFVAEKMAALNVVHRRLEEQGLGVFCLELHSSKAHKATVLKQLGRAWEARESFAPEEWQREAARLKGLRDALNAVVRRLHARHPNGWTLHEAIGRTVRDATPDTPVLGWPRERVHDREGLERLRDVVHRLALLAQGLEGLEGLDRGVLAVIEMPNWSNAWQAETVAAASGLIALGERMRAAWQTFAAALGLQPCGGQRRALHALHDLATLLPQLAGADVAHAFAPDLSTVAEAARAGLQHLAAHRQGAQRLSLPYPPAALRALDLDGLRQRWTAANARAWPFGWFARRGVLKGLLAELGLGGRSDLARLDLAADLPVLEDLQGHRAAIERLAAGLAHLPGWAGLDSDTERLGQALERAEALRAVFARLAGTAEDLVAVRAALRRVCVDGNALLADALPIAQAAQAYRASYRAFTQALDRLQAATRGSQPLDGPDLPGQAATLGRQLVDQQRALKPWCDWRRVRNEALSLELQPLVAALESGALGAAALGAAFETAYARWWAQQQLDAEPVLRDFVPALHRDKIEAFRALDEKLLRLAAQHVRARICGAIPVKDDVAKASGHGVLRHELQKRARHLPLRELTTRAGEALTTLTPCLLMSPLSIAQYLPPTAAPFDLVIFDEASQITPWDAIGAIARGQQVIVAGDPKQMPPTSFFDRGPGAAGVPDDDEDDQLESILDECLSADLRSHRLTWHYRSRHESLIAFSNHRYYDGELITFPAAVTRQSAVTLVAVRGAYAKGKGRTNQAEAEAMVAEIVRRLTDPACVAQRRSLGVVTLNAEQQQLVEDLLDRERQRHPALEPYFKDDSPEPVVVKNLETVQGDERDLILLGIGYGPESPDAPAMSMNFGPLNRAGGWRRLNVAITRAREELMIFASFPPQLIDLTRTSAPALRDLKAYLEFAAHGFGALARSPRGAASGGESALEQAIARGLRAKGWTVVPQIGVSRFRVDLGIVHPDRPSDYLLGVECDGAAYHSASTARDRDKVRARILTDLGWQLARAWSTDWWIDREGALDRLDRELRAALDADRRRAAGAVA